MSWFRVEVTKYASGEIFAYVAFCQDGPLNGAYPQRDGIVVDYAVEAGSNWEAEAKAIELREAEL